MTTKIMNIVMSSSDEYSIHCGTLIISILKNSLPDEIFNFYILETDITEENKKKLNKLCYIKPFNINFIRLNKELFKEEYFTKEYSYMPQVKVQTFYKYLIPKILKDIDKVLYLDVDTLVLASISEFYNTDLEDKYAAVVENNDSYSAINKVGVKNYFNAGVILYNLKKCRKDNITEKLFQNHVELFKQEKLRYVDQCVLNYTFNDNIVIANLKFNVGTQWIKQQNKECQNAIKNAVIAHFTTPRKPWDMLFTHPCAEKYFYYLPFSTFEKQKNKLLHSYKKYKLKKFFKSVLKPVKLIYSFVMAYLLFPWYVYKTYKLVKAKG